MSAMTRLFLVADAARDRCIHDCLRVIHNHLLFAATTGEFMTAVSLDAVAPWHLEIKTYFEACGLGVTVTDKWMILSW